MKKRFVSSALLFITLGASPAVPALSMDQFMAICESVPGECAEHPVLQAYVGGALDLIAMLDEETDYLGTVYCQDPKELFNVDKIIRFMESKHQDYESRNAMLLLIAYLEQHGGCR